MMIANVLLAEHDTPLGLSVLQGLEKVALAGDWVRSATELRSWMARRRTSLPKLVLLDWELPGAPRGEALQIIQSSFPPPSIIVLGERLSGDHAALLLSQGIPSLQKPVNPVLLSLLALGLGSQLGATTTVAAAEPSFGSVVEAYASRRKFSKQQVLILDLYLNGHSDKEIAEMCGCSSATVYEHWRRMAKKIGGSQKQDIISNFHRHLRRRGGEA
jgi:DNA-binding NarL/FixJ family response regulator